MRFYQFSKLPAFQLAACIVVAIAVLVAFANIFNWLLLPDSLGWLSFLLRALMAILLFGTWLLLNIPPPRLPNAKLVVAFAELGEEKEYDGAEKGRLRSPRRSLLVGRRDNDDIFDEEIEPEPLSYQTKQIIAHQIARYNLGSGIKRVSASADIFETGALPAATSGSLAIPGLATALTLPKSNEALNPLVGANGHAADGSSGLNGQNGPTALATAKTPTGVLLAENRFKKAATPPPYLGKWKEVVGARELTDYLQDAIKYQLMDAGLYVDDLNVRSEAAVYGVDYIEDGAMAQIRARQVKDLVPPARKPEDLTKLLAVVWGWNLHRTRRDFVPVFEMFETPEKHHTLVSNLELLGLASFDLGPQNARASTVFASFVSGLSAYGLGKFDKACSEFSLALTASYTYEAYADEEASEIYEPGVDRAIINFFLGNAYCLNRNYQAAARGYREALSLTPDLFEARHNLGVTNFLLGRVETSVKILAKLIEDELTEADPEMAVAQYNLGVALLEVNDFENARDMLGRAIQLNPQYAAAYRAIGASYFREEHINYRRALEAGQRFEPDEWVFKQSLHSLNKALEYKKDFALVHVDLAELYFSRIKIYGLEPIKKEAGQLEKATAKEYASPEIEQQARFYIQQATEQLEKALKLNYNLPEAHYFSGEIQFEDYPDQAAESLREAIKLRPGYGEAHVLLGEVYMSRGQRELAAREFELASKAGKFKLTSAHDYINLGIGLLKDKQFDKARAEFMKALRMEPENAEAMFQVGNVYFEAGVWDQALSYYQKAQGLPNAPDELYNAMSVAYRRLGNDQGAFQVVSTAITYRPNSAKLHYYLGNAYRNRKDEDNALRSYIRAIEIDPNLAEAHFNLGQIYLNRKQNQDAIIQFKSTVSIAPMDSDGWLALGRTYARVGQFDDAVKALREALELKPEMVDARLALGVIYLQQADADAAIEQLQEILRYSPNDIKARELLGKAFAQAGKLESAIETFQGILAVAPDSAEAHYNLGISFSSQERYMDAELEFRAFIQLKPTDPDGYFNLGVALSRQDSDQKDLMAIEAFQKVIQLSPSKAAVAYYELGQMYFRYKDFEKGQKMIAEYSRLKGAS